MHIVLPMCVHTPHECLVLVEARKGHLGSLEQDLWVIVRHHCVCWN